ncbi:MAG: hypothetical protein SVR94_10235, partial [Pseudomonadota bacterium]|nr:hypothetical protein [Pseudomonadota bacterium]
GADYYSFDGNSVSPLGPIADKWGKLNIFAIETDEKLRHAFTLENKTYFITDNYYFCYFPKNNDYSPYYDSLGIQSQEPFKLIELLSGYTKVDSWEAFRDNYGKEITNAFILEKTLYLFAGAKKVYIAIESASLLENEPWSNLISLEAAWVSDGILYIIGGEQFITWNNESWSEPQSIIPPEGENRLWGKALTDLIAGFKGLDGEYYFFSQTHYVEAKDNSQLRILAAKWGEGQTILTSGIDVAFKDKSGRLYLFKDQYFLSYASLTASYPETVMPQLFAPKDAAGKPITPDKVDAAFNYNDQLYFFRKEQYLRCSKSSYPTMDEGYPLELKGSWANLPDYYNTHLQAGFYQGEDFYLFSIDPTTDKATYIKYQHEDKEHWPYELSGVNYEIIRLTSNTAQKFSQQLFAKGVVGLLTLKTQREDELPKFAEYNGPIINFPVIFPFINSPWSEDFLLWLENFSSKDTIYYREYAKLKVPTSFELDFASANGSYYWEIFFHIPYLIAQTLNTAQRFEEAKKWYQYVYDPTEPKSNENTRPFWKFLPFHDDLNQTADWDIQLDNYRDDPFDPHGIARLRPIAYRKALVMSYIDNLLDWGDLLFQQYTRETINEARMLYILAYDLLGKRPENLGVKKLEPAQNYRQIYADFYPGSGTDNSAAFAILLELENDPANATIPEISTTANDETPHDDFVALGYFFIPENELFIKYWDRVEDRLHKIRHCLNIEGIKQPLALFEPPLDPMALVQAAAGGGLSRALADFNVSVPHYRFNFMLAKVREFTGRVIQLGSTLLSTLEKKDAEELGLLRNTQEKSILTMSLEIKEKQLENVKTSLASLQASLNSAQERQNHYQKLLDEGLSTYEEVQVAMMAYSKIFSITAQILGAASSVASLVPNTGSPCAMTYGGREVGASLERATGVLNALAGTFDFASNLSATLGGWDRRAQDWQLQQKLASHDIQQINHQIAGTQIQIQIAQKEIEVQKRQIKHNEDIDTFMHSKFTNKQLYQWMASKLAGIYFQTYQMALDLAKGLQRAFQFELGLKESEVNFITSVYWDSLHKGLLAGEQLQKDLDRMEKAYLEKNHRRFEISKTVALSQIAPLALLRLKQKRDCEFTLTESLFDYDFPGHYCRQIKTISISFPAVVGQYQNLNATLTQLAHH